MPMLATRFRPLLVNYGQKSAFKPVEPMKYFLPFVAIAAFTTTAQLSCSANPIWQSYFDAGQQALLDHDDKKASSLFQASLKEARMVEGATPELANSLFAVAATTVQSNQVEAEPLLKECLKVDSQVCGEKSACEGLVYNFLGDIALRQNRLTDAESFYRQAASDLEAVDKDKVYSARILSGLSVVFKLQGKQLEAQALQQAPQPDVSATEDIVSYVKFIKNPQKASESKIAEAINNNPNISYRLTAPMTMTRGIDSHGYPMISMRGTFSPQSSTIQTAQNSNIKPPVLPIKPADVNWGPYSADLQRRIKRAWFPPKGNETTRVVVLFIIHPNGEMTDARIATSSGVAEADQAAIKAIENGAPYRRAPIAITKPVEWQFTFDYNVFTGGGGAAHRVQEETTPKHRLIDN